jgi:uncharacterized protein (TIGR00251 family)
MIRVIEREGEVLFEVRVTPRAGRDALGGVAAGVLRVRLAAPAIEGRANEALRRFLARSLNVPVSAVRIVAGERSRSKRVAIRGVSAERVASLGNGHPWPVCRPEAPRHEDVRKDPRRED